MKKEELTEEARDFMEQMYDKDINEVKRNWILGIDRELMIASLNHAGTCDEAHPDHDFIAGALWMKKKCQIEGTDGGKDAI